jgi:hypothetical protein
MLSDTFEPVLGLFVGERQMALADLTEDSVRRSLAQFRN